MEEDFLLDIKQKGVSEWMEYPYSDLNISAQKIY